MIVLMTNLADLISVLIHAWRSAVAVMLNVKSNIIRQYATVHKDYKETLWFPVKRWNVALIMTVTPERNAIYPFKNVFLFAQEIFVLMAPHALPKIIGKPALAILLSSEMVITIVKRVREFTSRY